MRRSNRNSLKSPSCRPCLEALEDRLVPTTTVYLDFGELFPSGGLSMTVAQLEGSVSAGNLNGPDLTEDFPSNNASLIPNMPVTFQSLKKWMDTTPVNPAVPGSLWDYNSVGGYDYDDFRMLRDDVLAIVRRQYAPFDVEVKLARAASRADVVNSLQANNHLRDGKNDAYVFVCPTFFNLRGSTTSLGSYAGLAGMASDDDLNGVALDTYFDRNDLDETAAVFAENVGRYGSPGYVVALANVASHEAAHTFGLAHTLPSESTKSDIMHNGLTSELYDSIAFFSHFPHERAEFGWVGDMNGWEWLKEDDDIGLRPGAPEYVTGTGASDTIWITRVGSVGRVGITAGAGSPSSHAYFIPLDRGIHVDAGRGDDLIIIDSALESYVTVVGGDGTDRLRFVGNGLSTQRVAYHPHNTNPSLVNGQVSYSADVSSGRTYVRLEEFEPGSAVELENVFGAELFTSGGVDDLRLNGLTASGTTNGIPWIPLDWRRSAPLSILTFDLAKDDHTDVTDTVQLLAPFGSIWVDARLQKVRILTGGGDDVFNVGASALTLPSPGSTTWPGEFSWEGGNGIDRVTAVGHANYRLQNGRLIAGGDVLALGKVEEAILFGSEGLDLFTILDWQGTAELIGRGGEDQVNLEQVRNVDLKRGSDLFFGNPVDEFRLGGATIQVLGIPHALVTDVFVRRNVITIDDGVSFLADRLQTITIDTGDGTDEVSVRTTAARLAIYTGGGADTVIVSNTARAGATIDTGSEADRVTIHQVSGPTSVVTGDGDDTVSLTPDGRNLESVGGLTVAMGVGLGDSVIIDDRNNPYSEGGGKTYTVNSGRVERTRRFRERSEPIVVTFTGVDALTLSTGGDSDTIDVESIPGPTIIEAGIGADTIRVTPAAKNLELMARGLTVRGGADAGDTIELFDQNYPFAMTSLPGIYTLTANSVGRYFIPPAPPGQPQPAPAQFGIGFTSVEGVNLMTGNGPGTFLVQGTPGNSTITSGAGPDNFVIGPTLANLRGNLTLLAGLGANTLTVNEVAPPADIFRHYQLGVDGNRTTVAFNFARRIAAENLAAVNFLGSPAPDLIAVQATLVPTTVNGGGGNDTITVANPGRALADALAGVLSVQGGADSDTLNVNDQAASVGNTYTLRSTAMDVPSRTLLEYGTFDHLNLTLSNQPDVLDITSNPYPTIVTVNGGMGIDTLTGSNAVNLFIIQGLDSGLHTYGTTFYNSFENLLGGSGIDLFVFQGGSVSGTIVGQGGTDTLNYAAWADPVSVSLLEGRATAVGGGSVNKIFDIENAIGGHGSDMLIGDGRANALSGGDGDDTIEGGAGADILIGGTGADVLRGSLGEDLLIGGSVLVTDPTDFGRSLVALRDHWARTDLSYDERVALLQDDFISALVQDDLEPDELWGQENRDWFWALPEEIRDHDPFLLELIGGPA